MLREPQRPFSLPSYPAVLDEQQAAKCLGYNRWEMKFLIKSKHLKVSGTPRRRTQKKFATAYILELLDDVEWHSEARDLITANWRKINARKSKGKTATV